MDIGKYIISFVAVVIQCINYFNYLLSFIFFKILQYL